MITLNGPFIIAMIIILFVVYLKWMEWFLFRDGTFDFKKRSGQRVIENAGGVKYSKMKAWASRLKDLLFFGKADLKRPWYAGLPFALLIMANYFINLMFDLETYHLVCYYIPGLFFAIWLNIIFILKANKNFFSDEDRRKRYLKTQMAQAVLTIVIVAILLASLYGGFPFGFEDKYKDPAGLAESVDWVIEPVYDGGWAEFSEGLAPVGSNGEMGFINKNGDIVIPFQYNDAQNFQEGLAAVQEEWRWGYIDRNGNEIIPFQYEETLGFSEGLAPVKKDGKWLVIDSKGKVQFETNCNWIGEFHEGVAVVEIRDKEYHSKVSSNLIDKEGNLLFKKDYDFNGFFNEGCISVYDKDAEKGWFYLDKNEKRVFSQDFVLAENFTNGFAPVYLENDEYGLIDHSGRVIKELSEEEYDSYLMCHEGLIIFNNGKWDSSFGGGDDVRYGFKDIYGNIIIPARFRNVSSSSEGLIEIEVDGFWGFIDNPLPEAARGVTPEVWEKDRTKIGTVEGLPVYAGELESCAYNLIKKNPELVGVPAYKKAFEQFKIEKAFEKHGKNIEPEKIQYQIGDTYYRKLLL